MQADFDKQLSILDAFSHLREDWKEQIKALIEEYKEQRTAATTAGVHVLAAMLMDMCSYQVSQKVLSRKQARQLQTVSWRNGSIAPWANGNRRLMGG